jgi:hypothetical protein
MADVQFGAVMTAAALECRSCRDAAILTAGSTSSSSPKSGRSRVTRWLRPALERDSQLEIHRQKPVQQRGVGPAVNAVIEIEQN